MFNVTLPGTGGMLPLPSRFLTGLFVTHNGSSLLIDCGEGMQIALAKWGCKLAHLDIILITHIHADHTAGLPGLLLSAGNYGKTTPLDIYCPEGAGDSLRKLMCICPEIPFEVRIHELSMSESSQLMWNDIEVNSLPLMHRVNCLGYNLCEKRLPVFDPKKADKLGIPPKMRKLLHSGGTAEINGKIFTQSDVVSEYRAPLKITYVTDTLYFDGIAEFAEKSDLFICEGMYGDDEYIPKMTEKRHMVFSQAAKLAAAADVGELWLTHYSPALPEPAEYEEFVRGIFENTVVSSDGQKREIR